MALTLDKLKQQVKGFQDKQNDRSGDWPRVVFLPEGNHKVRFISDPVDEAFIQYAAYGYFNRGIRDPWDHPSELPEGFENKLSELYKEKFAPRNKWSFGRKEVTLAYVFLYETDAKSENWEPGNLYVVIGNNKFAESFVNFLTALAKDAPEEIMKTLSPASEGVLLDLKFKFGKDGYCNMGASFPTKMVPAIDLKDHVYVDLQQAYIKPGFNQAKYDALVKHYEEQAAKLEGTPLSPAEGEEAPAPAAKPEGEIPAQPAQPAIPLGASMIASAAAAPAAATAPAVDNSPPFDGGTKIEETPAAAPAATSASPWDKFRKPA